MRELSGICRSSLSDLGTEVDLAIVEYAPLPAAVGRVRRTILTGAICVVWVKCLDRSFPARVPSKELAYEPVAESVAGIVCRVDAR